MGNSNRGGPKRRSLLTITALAAALAQLAGAGNASADPAPGPPVPVNPRVLHLPDLEIAPSVFQPSAYSSNVVIRNTGSGASTTAVLAWKLTPEIVNSCWCLAWGDAPVAPLQPGAVTAVDMCAVLAAQTSWLDDGITAKDLVFEVAQTAGGELDLSDNTRTLHISCKA
jgi:hypothetical protein